MWDTVIVGGGPAGLSAALILGRCRRRVLVCDAGRPRNAPARIMHGFLSRDGMPPGELLEIAREQLRQYPSVEFCKTEVRDAEQVAGRFRVELGDGRTVLARTLLLATGVVDVLPEIDGLRACYGISVFHCPYCDGWELRDKPLAVLGDGDSGAALALKVTVWTGDVALCTHGGPSPNAQEFDLLARRHINVYTQPITALEHENGQLRELVFANGARLARQGLFFSTAQYQRSSLAVKLGCRFTDKGVVDTDKKEASCVPGVWVAGDASDDPQMVIVAAAEGAQAAVAINEALLEQALAADRSF